ncbi:MAG: hypothetical protein KDA80_02920 [Planctomycetaceae bacterium]|nr:hypothetical protein [Planctomycetaceae bacterium]
MFEPFPVMEKLSRLTTEDRDNLAAYLDGELDEESTRRIESVLAQSTVARNDVEMLARTYEALDLLPRPHATEDFTERTVATAKLETLKKPLSQQLWFQKARRVAVLLAWGAAMLLMATCGYALTYHWIDRPNDVLLDELPMIQNLDGYIEIDSVEFLNRLSAEPQLLEEMRAGEQE